MLLAFLLWLFRARVGSSVQEYRICGFAEQHLSVRFSVGIVYRVRQCLNLYGLHKTHLNPNPKIPNAKPSTLNPKPSTLNLLKSVRDLGSRVLGLEFRI